MRTRNHGDFEKLGTELILFGYKIFTLLNSYITSLLRLLHVCVHRCMCVFMCVYMGNIYLCIYILCAYIWVKYIIWVIYVGNI